MQLKNHSYFFVPFRIQNIDAWKEQIETKVYEKNDSCMNAWQKITNKVPVYLMKFMNEGVGLQTERHYAYQLVEKRAYDLPYTGENNKPFSCTILYNEQHMEYVIDMQICIHCFGTNIGFLVYNIGYSENLSYEEILTFIYVFKKIGTAKIGIPDISLTDTSLKEISLYALSESMITNGLDNVEIFFYANHKVRMTSNTFSIFCDTDKSNIDDKLFHFSHAFTYSYGYDDTYHDNSFCCYHPYAYIHWGYCPDGISCVYYDINDFTSGDLKGRLRNDYYFMYLVLLNQKYTLLSLIGEMMERRKAPPEEWRCIQHKLIAYQIGYSFRIVSDEMTYRRIYSDIRKMLSIDELENDIKDISNRVYQIRNEEQHEKDALAETKRNLRINLGLGFLSLLTVISALVDSTDLLDMWFSYNGVSCPVWIYGFVFFVIFCVAIGVIKILFYSYLQYNHEEKTNDETGEKHDDKAGLYKTK